MWSKITPFLKSQAIEKYLHALSMNEIVRELPLSKGTVHSIIHEWRSKLGGTNVEEIRAFTSEVRKSSITIEECAQGHRIIQLLKKFVINDEFDVNVYEDEHEDLDPGVEKSNFLTNRDPSTQNTNEITNPSENRYKKSTKIENNKIIYFLDHIYKNCNKTRYNAKYSDRMDRGFTIILP